VLLTTFKVLFNDSTESTDYTMKENGFKNSIAVDAPRSLNGKLPSSPSPANVHLLEEGDANKMRMPLSEI